MKKIVLILIVFLIQLSQASDFLLENNVEKRELIESSFSRMDSIQFVEKEKISGFKAALYSAVVPGAGQFYTESYWRAAMYATLEVAIWTTYFIYDAKGADKDKQMRRFGDTHWSESKYWTRLYNLAVTTGENVPQNVVWTTDNQGYNVIENYKQIVGGLRLLEHDLEFSHSLPSTKTQQYYEMIYKYPEQFANGWDDAILDYGYAANGSDIPARATNYRYLRNLTEEYYDAATAATWAAILNHVISAMDAALAAKAYNESLSMKFTVQNKYLPTEKVKMYGLQFTW